MRSTLVLLLVLAIGGGIAGLFFLSKRSQPGPPINGPGVTETAAPTRTDAELVGDAEGRGTLSPVTTPSNDGRSGVVSPTNGDELAAPADSNLLTGVVHDDKGQPVPGARVTLTRQLDPFFSTANTLEDDPTVQCDAEGRFLFEDIEPFDHYSLVARHPQYSRAELKGIRVAAVGEHEAPTPLVLGSGAHLSGQVIDQDKNPIAGAELRLASRQFELPGVADADAMETSTDEMGRYEFKGVSPNLTHLRVAAEGYGTVSAGGFNFRNAIKETRDVVLFEGDRIGGRVIDDTGKPVANARLIAFGQPRRPSSMPEFRTKRVTPSTVAVSGADGSFLFEDLDKGTYSLSVQATGFKMDRGHSQVETGEMNLEIRLLRRATISGRVVTHDTGSPVTSGTVRLRFSNQHSPITTPTPHTGDIQPDGTFSIGNVPKGNYVVEADSGGYSPSYSAGFTVVEGQSVPGIEVVLQAGGSMSGRVTDADGNPIGGARVTTQDATYTDDMFTRSLGNMMPTDATSKASVSRKDGTFEIKGLHPAKYQIRVQAPGRALFVRTDIEIREGVNFELKDLRVPSGGEVIGKVLNAGGQPAGGIQVRMQRTEHSFTHPLLFETHSRPDGTFQFTGVNAGTYRLQAVQRKPGGIEDIFGGLPTQGQSMVQIVVTEGQKVTKDLRLES